MQPPSPPPAAMVRPTQDAIDTFVGITGADEAVAARKLEVTPTRSVPVCSPHHPPPLLLPSPSPFYASECVGLGCVGSRVRFVVLDGVALRRGMGGAGAMRDLREVMRTWGGGGGMGL